MQCIAKASLLLGLGSIASGCVDEGRGAGESTSGGATESGTSGESTASTESEGSTGSTGSSDSGASSESSGGSTGEPDLACTDLPAPPEPAHNCGDAIVAPGEECDVVYLGGRACDAACRFTDAGAFEWQWTLPEPLWRSAAHIGPDHRVIRGGVQQSGQWWFGSLSPTDQTLDWASTFEGPTADWVADLKVGPDGSIVVVAHDGDMPLVMKVSAAGELVWTRVPASPGVPSDVAVHSDGEIVVLLYHAEELGSLLALSPTGDTSWSAGLEFDGSGDVAIDRTGATAVAGRVVADATEAIYVAKYDRGGDRAWSRRFEQSLLESDLHPIASEIAIGNDDTIVVAGSVRPKFGRNFWLGMLTADGETAWSIPEWLDDFEHWTEGLAVDPCGRILLLTSRFGSEESAASVLSRYTAAGELEWSNADAGDLSYAFNGSVMTGSEGTILLFGHVEGIDYMRAYGP